MQVTAGAAMLPGSRKYSILSVFVFLSHFLEQTFFSKTKSERGFPISEKERILLLEEKNQLPISFYGCKALLGATLPMATNVAKITFPRTLRDILSPQAALTTLSDVAFTIGAARCERMKKTRKHDEK